ncbi:hypothetical protein MycrhDRAFT_1706 [Mycolicibacterium rhodesiae JS60]|nr:hypothetical protein MycrhDRAFT_1706 [Mycolicibacterium rhodesiae JS60]
MPAVKALSATRAAIGASGWAMPITAGRLFGIDASKDVSAALYLRLGGTRDFALAAGPLVTRRLRIPRPHPACSYRAKVRVAVSVTPGSR